MTSSLITGNGKDLVSYAGVPAVPPPPLPKNFTLEFKNLVKDFDAQCRGFEALQAEWEKRNHPVLELPRDFETCQSGYGYISHSAKRLLEKLQALWPDENIRHHASHGGIAIRLGLMRDRLPKGEETDAKSLVERIEAELPSIMMLESTCRELEDSREKFPLPRDILPVLQTQKRIWERRMEAVDIEHIEELSDEYTAGRQKQHAILEKAVRERLVCDGLEELLTFLDADKRVDECVHYVAAVANLHQENCFELANQLQENFETYQRLSAIDEDDENAGTYDAWEQAASTARQTYEEALRVAQEKRGERAREKREQALKEQERQRERRRWEEEERRWEEEHWRKIELSQQIEDSLFTREAIAMFESGAVRELTREELRAKLDEEAWLKTYLAS